MEATATLKHLHLQACDCGHTLMFFNKSSDTWDCSQCRTQRADHTTPFWQIRRVPNTRGSRFALYDNQPAASPQPESEAPPKVEEQPTLGDMREYLLARAEGTKDHVVTIATACGVKAGMRLANTPSLLCDELHLFFRIVDPHVRNAQNKSRRWTQSRIAASLNMIGVTSADGQWVENSHVSNCIRKAVFERGPSCYKENYQGMNWLAFRDH
jgi:hypothetical protein